MFIRGREGGGLVMLHGLPESPDGNAGTAGVCNRKGNWEMIPVYGKLIGNPAECSLHACMSELFTQQLQRNLWLFPSQIHTAAAQSGG